MKKNIPNWKCEECIHSTQETTDDVACCNCCEDGSFFEQYRAGYLDDEDEWKCCRCKCIDMDTEDKIYCCKNCREYDHFIPADEEMEICWDERYLPSMFELNP